MPPLPPDQRDRQDAARRRQRSEVVAASAVPPPTSVFAGKGLFTTSDASSASGLGSDWVAVQRDPEGDQGWIINNNPGQIMHWAARPTQEIADEANKRRAPFIGQAENQAELEACLALDLTVPKALVGNPTGWSAEGAKAAAAQRWDLICEFYWNKEPWLTGPDADNYPRFVNVCFGIFNEAGTTPKTLEEYRAVWPGSFSVWCAEQMTADDRKAYA